MKRVVSNLILVVVLCIGVMLLPSCTDPKSIFNKELSAEEVYQKVSESVVEINGQSDTFTTTGTGFFCDAYGTVVTNYHVIQGCTKATIKLNNGVVCNVEGIKGYSEERDIAILKTNCINSKPLYIREKPVETGETVYAIGSSLGLSGTLSNGIVSTASRYVEGYEYIQTSTPISQGNSGGPLIDKKGYVVGITTASFTEGQNLNLAIPISEVNKINVSVQITLSEFSKVGSSIEWIKRWRIQYEEDDKKFILFFALTDDNDTPLSTSGNVNIRIENDASSIVYEADIGFSEADFGKWSSHKFGDEYLAAIYIDEKDIEKGITTDGTVYFTVTSNECNFEECSTGIYDLPLKETILDFGDLPIILTEYGYWGDLATQVKINNISYEIMYGNSMYIYIAGEKVYDAEGKSEKNECWFEWRLYDSDRYLIDSGTVMTDRLIVGDKFKDEEIYIFDKIIPGEKYRLEFSDYKF